MNLYIDPIRYIEENFTLNGNPFKIIDDNDKDYARHYLRGIYNYLAFKVKKDPRPVVIVKGRQVEMTTTSANIVAFYLQEEPYIKVLYTFPTPDQAKTFSDTRIEPLRRYKRAEGILEQLTDGTYNKSVKQFQNGSTLYVYGVGDQGNKIRSISADILIKDEYQDLGADTEESIDETVTHSKYKINISLGTPKEEGSRFENRWKSSTQRYYHLQCPICKHWFTLQYDYMVRGHNVKCPKCGNVEDKRDLMKNGRWMEIGKKDAPFIGFHLSQLYVPYITLEDIKQKVERRQKEGKDPVKYLKNEILGEFYSGNVVNISQVSVDNMFTDEMKYGQNFPIGTTVFAGIDWGGLSGIGSANEGSYSVIAIGALDKKGRLLINYIERITQQDELAQVEYIKKLLNKYRVSLAVADKGYGKIKNTELKRILGPRFKACKYVQGNATITFKYKEQEDYLIANRDYFLEELFNAIERGLLKIVKFKDYHWVKAHFAGMQAVLIERGNRVLKHYRKKEGAKYVDAVHAINFLRIASFYSRDAIKQSPFIGSTRQRRSRFRPMLVGGRYDASLDPVRNHLRLLKNKPRRF